MEKSSQRLLFTVINVLLLVFVCILLQLDVTTAWKTEVYCYHSNEHLYHSIECNNSAYIHIHEAYYGYSENYTQIDDDTAECYHNESHCTTPFEKYLCHQSSACLIPQDLLQVRIESHCARSQYITHSNYLFVNYTCMTASELDPVYLVSNDTRTSSSVNILSPDFPGFPMDYPNASSFCFLKEANESLSSEELNLTLTMNYFNNYESLEGDCEKAFQIRDYSTGEIIFQECDNKEHIDKIFIRHSPKIQIRFASGTPKLWLSYEANRELTLDCIDYMEEKDFNAEITTSTPVPTAATTKRTPVIVEEDNWNVTAWIFVISACVAFIFAVILGTVYYIRRKYYDTDHIRLEEEETSSAAAFTTGSARYSCQDDTVFMEKNSEDINLNLNKNDPAVLQLSESLNAFA